MTPRQRQVDAMVLSGGGAFAAYEVGVAQALLFGEAPTVGGRPLAPEILAGTSAGAFNAALLTAAWELPGREAAAVLQRIWLDEVSSRVPGCDDGGVLRWRGTPLNFFDLGCLVSDPLRFAADRVEDAAFFSQDLIRRVDQFVRSGSPLDARVIELVDFSTLVSTAPFPETLRRVLPLERIRRSPRQLRITATNFDTGQLEVFSNADLTDESGDLIVMASSAAPGIFPPVRIPPSTYIDGGVLMNTPLKPAIDAGATILHAVYLDPDVRHLPVSELQSTLGTLQRLMAIATASNFNTDAAMARSINEGLEALRAPGMARSDRSLLHAARESAAEETHRLLTIHRYHPRDPLGGPMGFLDFRRDTLERLMERGYRDAVVHDCAAAGCVLPGRDDRQDDDRLTAPTTGRRWRG